MSAASLSGHLELSSTFDWIGTREAVIGFAVAAALEIAAYLIPFLDNALDVIAAPAAAVAGTVLMASSVVEMSPFLKWTLAIVAGGASPARCSSSRARRGSPRRRRPRGSPTRPCRRPRPAGRPACRSSPSRYRFSRPSWSCCSSTWRCGLSSACRVAWSVAGGPAPAESSFGRTCDSSAGGTQDHAFEGRHFGSEAARFLSLNQKPRRRET
jgi:hypothetical protein